MSNELGPLPKPDRSFYMGKSKYETFSARLVRTYVAAEVAKERERCAVIVESLRLPAGTESCDVRDYLAEAIRGKS